MDSQLNILSESLDKKIKVLLEIQEYNLKQEESFKTDAVSLDDFDDAVEEKGRLIEELSKLDDGFEIMYEKLAEELKGNKEKYASQIKEIQKKIKEVTDLGVAISAQEMRNKKLVEDFFKTSRRSLGENRRSSKVAFDYYKSMSGKSYPTDSMWDSKQ